MATQLQDDTQADDVPEAALGADDAGEESQPVTVEQLASDMGWKPKDQYSGPEGKWKPAADFIKIERDISRGLKDDVKHLRRQIEGMAAAGAKTTERLLNEQAKDIEARFQQAVENKDTKAAAAAARDMRELETEATRTTGKDSVEDDFASANPWYNKDEEATAYAIAICQREAAKGKSIPDQLEAVTKAMPKRFPELFEGKTETPTRKPVQVAQPTARSTSATRSKGYADLPAEVRKAADDFARLAKDRHGKDPEKEKADYARLYWAEQS